MPEETEWTTVVSSEWEVLERIRVCGGYLYRSTQFWDKDFRTESMVFVPEKRHLIQAINPSQRAIEAWAPKCPGCDGKGHTGRDSARPLSGRA